jgi:hypothetical protein
MFASRSMVVSGIQLRDRFEHDIIAFMNPVEASKHYPWVETRWVAYLGEHPDLHSTGPNEPVRGDTPWNFRDCITSR